MFSFNNLAPNVNIPENCESCQFNKNDCPLEEVEETQTNDDWKDKEINFIAFYNNFQLARTN